MALYLDDATRQRLAAPRPEPSPQPIPQGFTGMDDASNADPWQPSTTGMLQAGNIDLSNRPRVSNPDGSISTVRSISVDQDGQTYLLPTVIGNRVVSNDEAIANWQRTGQNLGTFGDQQSAEDYANWLHEQQAATLGRPPVIVPPQPAQGPYGQSYDEGYQPATGNISSAAGDNGQSPLQNIAGFGGQLVGWGNLDPSLRPDSGAPFGVQQQAANRMTVDAAMQAGIPTGLQVPAPDFGAIGQGLYRGAQALDGTFTPPRIAPPEYGRTPTSDSLFTAGPNGEPVGPTGNVREMTLGREPVMGEDVNARRFYTPYGRAEQGALSAEEQAAFTGRGIAGANPAENIIGGGSGQSDFAALQAKAQAEIASTGAISPETHDALMNAYGESIGAIPTSEQPAARDAFYNAPENLGGGQTLSPEAQANLEALAPRAAQSNMIRDSLANARQPENVASLDAPFPTETRPGPTRGAGAGQPWQMPLDDVKLPNGADVHLTSYGDAVPGGYNGGWRMTDAATGETIGRIEYQSAKGTDPQIAFIEVAPKYQGSGASDALAARLKAEFPGQRIDPGMLTDDGAKWWARVQDKINPPEPNALDKVISRNADELPAPSRTQPPAGYLDRFKQPPAAGGADLPGSQQPMVPRGGSGAPRPSRPTAQTITTGDTAASLERDAATLARAEAARQASLDATARARMARGPGANYAGDFNAPTSSVTPQQITTGDVRASLARDAIAPLEKPSLLNQATDVANLPRTVLTSFDLSAPFRQGAMMIGHPKEFFGAMKPMLEAFASPNAANEVDTAIRSGARGAIKEQAGLYLSPLGNDGALSLREEAYMSRLAGKIPGVAGSERAYATFLNKVRSDVFDHFWENLPFEAQTQENAARYAHFINAATGRGSIPNALKDLAPALNAAFFSPRYFISRFESNGMGALAMGDLAKSAVTRQALNPVSKAIAGDVFKFYATGATALGLAAAAGASVEMDPRSSDFGKIRVGDTRYDVWAGNQQIARFIAMEASGQHNVNGRDVAYGRNTTALNFLRSKLGPVTGLVWDVLKGTTPTGDKVDTKPANLRTMLFNEFTPMVVQDILDGVRDSGVAGGLKALPTIVGMGTQTYAPTQPKSKTLLPKLNLPKTVLPKATLPKIPGYAAGTLTGTQMRRAAALPGTLPPEPARAPRMRTVKTVERGADGKIARVIEMQEEIA